MFCWNQKHTCTQVAGSGALPAGTRKVEGPAVPWVGAQQFQDLGEAEMLGLGA